MRRCAARVAPGWRRAEVHEVRATSGSESLRAVAFRIGRGCTRHEARGVHPTMLHGWRRVGQRLFHPDSWGGAYPVSSSPRRRDPYPRRRVMQRGRRLDSREGAKARREGRAGRATKPLLLAPLRLRVNNPFSVILTNVRTQSQAAPRSGPWVLTFVRMTGCGGMAPAQASRPLRRRATCRGAGRPASTRRCSSGRGAAWGGLSRRSCGGLGDCGLRGS